MSETNDRSSARVAFDGVCRRLQTVLSRRWNEGAILRRFKEQYARMWARECTYESLSQSSCIRLVRIEEGTFSEPIRCSFRTVDLNDDPYFTAISYSWREDKSFWTIWRANNIFSVKKALSEFSRSLQVFFGRKGFVDREKEEKDSSQQHEQIWADPDLHSGSGHTIFHSASGHTIFVDGMSIVVQSNLYKLLLRLRRIESREYWIDALCINQNDAEERNAQVRMMGRIYESAAKVVIWLGEMPTLLLPGMRRLSMRCCMNSPEAQPGALRSEHVVKFFESESFLDHLKDLECIVAGAYLLTRRWFRRLWIVQEKRLARQSEFILGDCYFETEVITSTINLFQQSISDSSLWEMAMRFVPLWMGHIRKIPELLNSSGTLDASRKITLLEWLNMVQGRKASDARDMIFAGLSLVQPDHFVIDQALQLPTRSALAGGSSIEDGVASISDRRLWDALHVDYGVDTEHVLLNLAACILSHQDLDTLLSITLRHRPLPNDLTLPDLPVYHYPSWVPDPSPWTTKVMEPFFAHNNPGKPVQSSVGMGDVAPQISSDGTTLFLTAVKFDVVAQHCPVVRMLTCGGVQAVRFLEFMADAVPLTYRSTGRSGLDTMIDIVMSRYRLQEEAVGERDTQKVLEYCCAQFDWLVRTEIPGSWQKLGDLRYCYDSNGSLDVEGMNATYARVQSRFPNAPWPKPAQERLKTKTCADKTHASPTASEEALLGVAHETGAIHKAGTKDEKLDNTSEVSGIIDTMDHENENNNENATTSSGHDESSKPSDEANYVELQLAKHLPWIKTQSFFVTANGYMGIGPNWLRDGDAIFLIADSNCPYVFAHMDEVFRRRSNDIRKELSRISNTWIVGADASRRKKAQLEQELRDVEAKIGCQDAWQVVGEAYVEGVMNGEIAIEVEGRGKRYGVV
ncbi:heterokaryon incompatibility protein-domain-containing protein [Paraphoma chrysanthemicola]|nr:heterokaryon incompatibility protein-domain-containing protein [Paraphoma chrysanthemicola]